MTGKTLQNLPRDDGKAGSADTVDNFLGSNRDKYLIEKVEPVGFTDENRFELSERIRNQSLYAFVEIPKGADSPDATDEQKIRFFAQDSSLSDARGWISQTVNAVTRVERFNAADIDPAKVEKASAIVPVIGMGLVTRAVDGSVSSKEEDDAMAALFFANGCDDDDVYGHLHVGSTDARKCSGRKVSENCRGSLR